MALFADIGLPMLVVVWPVAWLAFVPVVLIETLVALKTLKLGLGRALAVTTAANAVSTLVGIPITWFVMLVIEGTLIGGGSLWHASDAPMEAVVAACRRAAWLGPYERDWMVPLAAIILCVPFYFASVWIEYRVARAMVDDDRRQVRRFSWWANLWSYLAILVFWACCLYVSVYGNSSSTVPRMNSEQVTVIHELERLGGRIDVDYESPDRSALRVNLLGDTVNDAVLKQLTRLPNVQSLLLDTGITDRGAEEIGDLMTLRELWLRGPQITDAGLKHLKRLKNLQSLRLSETKVSEEGIRDLKRALPYCKIQR